jgi:hypothetical protein
MPTVYGSPFDRATDGIFCGPIGRATIGYWCLAQDIVDKVVSGATNRGSTGSLPYSGDKIWDDYYKKLKDLENRDEIDEEELRILRENEEIVLILKMFIRCQ